MSRQGELFPLVSLESLLALLNQWRAEILEIGPELTKDALLRLMNEVSLGRTVTRALIYKARITPEFAQRMAVKHAFEPVLGFAIAHSWQCRERPPGSTSPTLSLASSSTDSRSGPRTPGGRSSPPKWRHSSTVSNPA